MRDTRKLREALMVFLVGGIGAVVGAIYLKPFLGKKLGVK